MTTQPLTPVQNDKNASSTSPLPAEEGRALIAELMQKMDEKAADAKKYGGDWSKARWGTMVSLIVLSAIVAFEKNIAAWFGNTEPQTLTIIIGICAFLVAIGTAFDQAVKPGTRWRLSSGYETKFSDLKIKARMVDPTSRDAISQLTDKFEDLVLKWLDDTTV
jgi:hypothetical protein